MEILSLILTLSSTGGCIYLLIDKLILSKREKSDAHASESQAVSTSYDSLREVIKDLTANHETLQDLYDKALLRYSEVTSKLAEVQNQLSNEITNHGKTRYVLLQALQYIKEEEKNICRRANCGKRTPPHPDSATIKTYQLQLQNFKEECGFDYVPEKNNRMVEIIQKYLDEMKRHQD